MSFSTSPSTFSFRDAIIADIACAIIVHLIYKKLDSAAVTLHHTIVLLGLIPALPAYLLHQHCSSLVPTVAISFSVFYGTLLTSIATYRLSPFHPLAKYPGPVFLRISKLCGAYIMFQGKNQFYIKGLHEKYGQYVRIGPNELSVTDVSVLSDILGAKGMPKGPRWETLRGPETPANLISTRDLQDHAQKRKAWDRAFSTAGVKGFEPILTRRVLQLVDELKKRSCAEKGDSVASVNLAEWLGYFAFDFMGDMAFGGGFEMMHEGVDKSGFWDSLKKTARISVTLPNMPWAGNFIFKLPRLTDESKRRRAFAREVVKRRKESGSNVKDLFYHLMDEAKVEKAAPPSDAELFSNGGLAIIAGSDTTSTVLSELFFFLLTNPIYFKRLQEEVDTVFPADEGDPFDASKLATEMPFLNAVINETLRLGPPVATLLQRAPAKGSGGHWVGNNFLPEGTSVDIPPYAMARDPRYFSPFTDEFMPERWLASPQNGTSVVPLIKESKESNSVAFNIPFKTDAAALIPFSFGPANCVGRSLALLEMRMVVAALMQRFEMRFADGYDPKEWEEKLEDWFLLATGPLPVVLTPRD